MIAPLDLFMSTSSPSASTPSTPRLRTTVMEPKERDGFLAIAGDDRGTRLEFEGPEAWLHVYDLNGTEVANNTLHPLGLGLFHAGLEVYGVEWSFGGCPLPPGALPYTGVSPMRPRSCPCATYRESVSLGPIPISAQEVWQILVKLAARWLSHEYHPLKRNCLDFCSEFSRALRLQEVPGWLGRLASAADFLLSPVLTVLDAFHLLRDAPEALVRDEALPDWRDETSSQDAEAEAHCNWLTLSEGASRAWTSLETEVVLDFQEQSGWAGVEMKACHIQWEKELEEKRQQSLLAFL
ncbi:unnamed protein product [Durusdinium trenchii]|uniref:PPPDE domain-containing protein n=1 Tax=Durusdinium trenchii TaxID=1381693 RepID=A0ABP0N5L4_9DINO